MLNLDDRRVVVVGAGGLGAACVQGFLRAGATVVVADVSSEALDALATEMGDSDRLHTVIVDLSRTGAGEELIASAVDLLGGIDVAVHAIGTNDRRPVLEFSEAEWRRVLDVNLQTAFSFGQAAGRWMTSHGQGRIVFFSSVSGLLAHANHGPYAASKGAINQMMRVMAREWASQGVTVNAIAPGYIETPLTRHHLEQGNVRESLSSLVPAGRLGTPEEVVGPVLFLASDLAAFVTGHVLYVDGGRTLV
ncbi:SDR family NAD(P)-dependent oxidoreductase [Microbacterium sp. BR1]|uniref:SDR family NAD(P)-dependent oxidoreductase n=1 Tax=Microbacterium sp. BR1 TaxID=1070896 RepID=UPI000C2C3794|nr:SDR family NAD(P)-dependent oxidoreductase [Microbacterium sp. BR1]